jgi:hypothetical protein
MGTNLIQSLCLSLLKIHFNYDLNKMNNVKFNDFTNNNIL